jgi:hypothetical protein
MVREANVRQATAERALKESEMQIEVLTAEVAALKTLVLTSTPSRPNPHLHPQIDPRGNRPKDDSTLSGTVTLVLHFQILKWFYYYNTIGKVYTDIPKVFFMPFNTGHCCTNVICAPLVVLAPVQCLLN